MNITVKATHYELTDTTRNLVEKKLSSLEKFSTHTRGPAALECEIEESIAIERSGAHYRAEGNLSIGGKLFRAEATSSTLEGAVDKMRDELAQELRHARGKERGLLKRGGAALKRMISRSR